MATTPLDVVKTRLMTQGRKGTYKGVLHCFSKCMEIARARQMWSQACSWAAGAGAGAFTGVATTPLDVVKTRLMTQGRKGTYKGVLDCFQKIIADEGSSALFKVCLHVLESIHPTTQPCVSSYTGWTASRKFCRRGQLCTLQGVLSRT